MEQSVVLSLICDCIKKYLLCNSCDKPELILKIKNNQLYQKCKACGNKYYQDDHFINFFK